MAHDSKYDDAKPRKKPAPRNAPSNGFGKWQGWVNVSLPAGAKAQWMAWAQEPDKFFSALSAMLSDGYKITLKWEENNATYSSFATPADASHVDAGWGLSERAGDPYTALNRLVYIHAVVLGGDWSPYKTPVGWNDKWE